MTDSSITVVQVGSPIGRPADQRATLKGLGLDKIGREARREGHARQSRHDQEGRAPRARRRSK